MKGQAQSTQIVTIVTKDTPELLDKEAQTLAKQLLGVKGSGEEKKATITQLRRLFGTLRQIEMSWPREIKEDDPQAQQMQKERDDAYRELVLFKPRLAYQAYRHTALKPLADALQKGISVVEKDRKKLQRLVQFFEATVAYYVAGQEQGGA